MKVPHRRLFVMCKRYLLLLLLALLAQAPTSQACSMYKITVNGKTMVGCNEDAWRTTSRIWFAQAKSDQRFGAAFTGSREVSGQRTAPQSGMNEAGLVFSRLVAYHPTQPNPQAEALPITDEVQYLTNILHRCATVAEVKAYIERYDYSLFYDHVFIYVDSTGDYLVVEPYQLLLGREAQYVLSNFCPSITSTEQARKLERYRRGEDYLKTLPATASLDYCRALSDQMHVCRARNGDGTLLTSIWDVQNKAVNLYFYHNYDSTVQFKLSEALAKGDNGYLIPDLFPPNPEFARLASYKTPSNSLTLRWSLLGGSAVLTALAVFWGMALFRQKRAAVWRLLALSLLLLNLLLGAYLFVLLTNKNIFYFDAPYQFSGSLWRSLLAYLPFVLLLLLVPLSWFSWQFLRLRHATRITKVVLLTNHLGYLLLLMGFGYWGLLQIWV